MAPPSKRARAEPSTNRPIPSSRAPVGRPGGQRRRAAAVAAEAAMVTEPRSDSRFRADEPIPDPELMCRKCHLLLASALLLPCHHLTHCHECAVDLISCPVCCRKVDRAMVYQAENPYIYPDNETMLNGVNDVEAVAEEGEEAEAEYEVDRVVDCRGYNDSLQYRIVFRGWEEEKDWQWTPASDCDCHQAIESFKTKREADLKSQVLRGKCVCCGKNNKSYMDMSCGCSYLHECDSCHSNKIGHLCSFCGSPITSFDPPRWVNRPGARGAAAAAAATSKGRVGSNGTASPATLLTAAQAKAEADEDSDDTIPDQESRKTRSRLRRSVT